MKTLTLKHSNNFAILNEEFAQSILEKQPFAFVFIFKEVDKSKKSFILKKVDIEFTNKTQCGCVHQYKDKWLFENLCPENQQILYELGLPYNRDHVFTLKEIRKGEYELCQ